MGHRQNPNQQDRKASGALTPKQQRFVAEYLLDLNATQAATRAGYSPKTATQQGERLLRNVDIAAAVDRGMAARSRRTEITADRVVEELGKLGFANMGDYMRVGPDGDPALDWSKLSRDQAAAIVEVTVEDFKDGRGADARDVRRVKFKLGDKKGALDSLARHTGAFDRPVRLPLAKVSTAADAMRASAIVVAEMAAGRITPAEAQAVSAVLEANRKMVETADIDARLSRIEQRLSKP